MNTELQMLSQIENDFKWLQDNYNTLREKYLNKFVAIKEKDVIESDSDLKELINKLKTKGENPAHLLIEYIKEKGFKLIL